MVLSNVILVMAMAAAGMSLFGAILTITDLLGG